MPFYNGAMVLLIETTTALEFWRRVYPLNKVPSSPCTPPDEQAACTESEVFSLKPSWASSEFLAYPDRKLHVLVPEHSMRRRSQHHIAHTWSAPLSEGSFFDCGNGAFVSSPELVFLGAAYRLPLIELIALGDELCGLYSFDPFAKRGFRKRKVPLVAKAQLESYIASVGPALGTKKGRDALKYVVERSGSPMETFDEMTMCLPNWLGGYAIKQAKMNPMIPLTSTAARIARKEHCYGDLCWLDDNLIVEHQGEFDHTLPADVAADRARVNALREMGYEVIELTSGQVGDLRAYESIVLRIAAILGAGLRKENLGATPKRVELRNTLYAWNRSYGRLHY